MRIGSALTFLSACATSLFIACSNGDAPAQSFADPLAPRTEAVDDYVFVFGDEFDGDAVDTSKWLALDGDTKHKNTINSASPSMAAVHGGSMFVSAVPTPHDKVFPYTAGYVDTRGLFAQTYGRIEFRARSQYAPGVWYALWGRSWANLVPEIDIEFLAENINQVWFVSHWDLLPLPADDRRAFTTVQGMDITDFHTYTIIWKPDLVEWQIDGKAYMRLTDPKRVPHEPMYWVMNAWVGGWGGTPVPATIFPARIEVDYLRVFRLREWSTEPAIRVSDPKPKYPRAGAIEVEIADFGSGANVEVWEGDERLETLPKPPFRFEPKALDRGPHALRFVGTDGARRVSTVHEVTIY